MGVRTAIIEVRPEAGGPSIAERIDEALAQGNRPALQFGKLLTVVSGSHYAAQCFATAIAEGGTVLVTGAALLAKGTKP